MKLFVLLVAITWSSAAKLDKTYLPPRSAQTAGGSGNFLQTPVSGSLDYQGQNGNGFGQNGNSYSKNGNGISQNGNAYSQNENGVPQNGNVYSQNGNSVPQNGNAYSQNGNAYSQNENTYSQIGNGVPQNGNAYSQNRNSYSQNGNGFSQGGNNEYNNVNAFESLEGRPERAQAAFERNAAILRQDNQNDGETYAYGYETENGISAEESGVATNGVEAQGGFSYTGDDGQVYSIRYTADQNGFVPQGDHLPTPPPVPEEILKALEQNARDEAAGIYDDGLYNEAKYNGGDEYEYVNNDNSNNYNANLNNNYNAYNNQNEYQGDDDSVVTTSALIRNSPPAYRNQGANGASDQGVSNERYNPATSSQGVFNRGTSRQGGLNQGASNQGVFNQGGVNKAYLPPFADQRSSGPAFGSRTRPQNFSTRNGYNY